MIILNVTSIIRSLLLYKPSTSNSKHGFYNMYPSRIRSVAKILWGNAGFQGLVYKGVYVLQKKISGNDLRSFFMPLSEAFN